MHRLSLRTRSLSSDCGYDGFEVYAGTDKDNAQSPTAFGNFKDLRADTGEVQGPVQESTKKALPAVPLPPLRSFV